MYPNACSACIAIYLAPIAFVEEGDLAKKYFFVTIMYSAPFGPYSKEGYVRIDSGVSDWAWGGRHTEKNRAGATNSIVSLFGDQARAPKNTNDSAHYTITL